MLLANGEMIKNDVIEAFNRAVANPENQHEGGGLNWDFVDADMNFDLAKIYNFDYLDRCLEALIDNYFA